MTSHDKIVPRKGLAQKKTSQSGFKLVTRIRRTLMLIVVLSTLYIGFVANSSINVFHDWQRQQHESYQSEIDEIIFNGKEGVNFSSFAIGPRKTDVAEYVENDRVEAIQVLLEEIRTHYQLDGVYLVDDTERVYTHNSVVLSPALYGLDYLSSFGLSADLRLLRLPSDDDIVNTGTGFLNLEAGRVYSGIKIPFVFDVGDYAGEIYLVKEIFAEDLEQFTSEILANINSFEFVPRCIRPNLKTDLALTASDVFSALFLDEELVFQIPVLSDLDNTYLGAVEIKKGTKGIRSEFIPQFIGSIFPVMVLFIIILYFYRLLVTRLITPIEEIARVSQKISEGQSSLRLDFMDKIPLSNRSEVDVLGVHFNELMDVLSDKQLKLFQMNEELEMLVDKRTEALSSANKSLEFIAHTDALTGIGNRHAFDVFWAQIDERVRKGSLSELVFCILDCDHFKGINDTYGHQAGDRVLKVVSDKLTKFVSENGVVFRLGGDEFAIIVENEPVASVKFRVDELVIEIAQFETHTIQVHEPISVSVGITHYSGEGFFTGPGLIRHADIAMYVAKNSLSVKTVIYDAKKHADTENELDHSNVNSVMETLKTGKGLVLYYQPIYKLSSQKIDYYEVLSRLKIDGNIIYPNLFMSIVERSGMQVYFDKVVVEKTLEALRSGVIEKGCGVSVNLSAEAIVSPDVMLWFEPFIPLLADYKIVIEVTETTLITQLNEVCGYIEQFKRMGFKVALDDFGSGYSSISYLAHLPVDIIKFDICLARAAFQKERSAKLINGLANDLSNMGYDIVIEGVEDGYMFNMLSKMSPSHFQGYYINWPDPIPNPMVGHIV